LKFFTRVFKASFSAVANRWTIKTEKLEFDVKYLRIEGTNNSGKRLACTIQEIKAKDVSFSFVKDTITLKNWSKIEKKHISDLYNPDKPRNLAKSVTVA